MSNLVQHARGLPLVTKAAAAVYFVFSSASLLLRLRVEPAISDDPIHLAGLDPARFLLLRPGFIISYPWTVVTTAFVEPNIAFMLCGLAVLVTVGGFLERQWGPRHYALFLLVVGVVPVVTAVLAVIIVCTVRADSTLLYTTQIGGLAAMVSGFTVGLKQLIPDYNVKLFRGSVGFRMNDLPGFYTLVAPIMFTLLGRLGGVLLVNIGFFEAFVYLRFYKRDGPIHGDRSDAFAFGTFFPEFAQPVVRRIANGVYWAAVKCRLVMSDEGYQQAIDLESGVPVRTNPETGEVLVGEESDKDRRRALAARALEARLENMDTASSSAAAAASGSSGSAAEAFNK
ncbi:hypothetical protein EC988_001334 [Linderina pennispora]|nr:hypothetical protein EC988_001334 [Linderina pennispora]